ncbi:DUF2141 domain-containing protein [Imperialibacter sp.]|uniref:DUF2141 domain-containing protein n=1 Tax=Imperialibacter sp. TaxID=2038411 RepID=UPI0032EDEC03
MIVVVLSLLLNWLQSDSSGTLTVEIKGIKNVKGDIRVALYDLKENFLTDRLYKGRVEKVNGESVRVQFTNLPFGSYAVSVFHDENENGKLDTGLFGIPKEPYGFGNDSMGLLGPPDFEEASVTFQAKTTTHSISLR